jgi:hypothetical protein
LPPAPSPRPLFCFHRLAYPAGKQPLDQNAPQGRGGPAGLSTRFACRVKSFPPAFHIILAPEASLKTIEIVLPFYGVLSRALQKKSQKKLDKKRPNIVNTDCPR